MDLGTTACDQIGLHRLRVTSVHGALWLQTHFPSSEWDVLLNGQACFGLDCLSQLLDDAEAAGLRVQPPVAAQR